jgi:hypothetical protein
LGRKVLHQGKGSFILMELTNKSNKCGAKIITLQSEDVKIASDVRVLFSKRCNSISALIMNKFLFASKALLLAH